MKEEIIKMLTDSTDEIFLTFQSKLHVTSGDVSPLQQQKFDLAIEHLAERIVDILESQPKLAISSITTNEGLVYDAQALANDYEVFKLLQELQEKIEKRGD